MLPAQCVGLLAWADAKGAPFTEQDLFERFPVPDDMDSELGHPLLFWVPKLIELGYIENSNINIELKPSWLFTPPPSDASIPVAFKEFCKMFPGKVGSAPFCFGRLKKHKDWKQALPRLKTAVIAQIDEREIMVRRQEFVAPWKNLTTWINQRCWEDEIKYIKAPSGLELPEQYRMFLSHFFGATASPILTKDQYEDFMVGRGDFPGIRNKVSLTRMESMMERAHREYYNNTLPPNTPNTYLRLVQLFKDATR